MHSFRLSFLAMSVEINLFSESILVRTFFFLLLAVGAKAFSTTGLFIDCTSFWCNGAMYRVRLYLISKFTNSQCHQFDIYFLHIFNYLVVGKFIIEFKNNAGKAHVFIINIVFKNTWEKKSLGRILR